MIKQLLEKYKIALNCEVQNIEWKTEKSTDKTILFYTFNKKDVLEEEKFNQRIADLNYALIVTNHIEDKTENIFKLDNDNYSKLQDEVLNFLHPLDQRKVYIGVTGTNGKTTCTDLMRQILVHENKNVMTIGTLGVYLNNNKIQDFSLTTPSKIDLQKILSKNSQMYEFAVMEVSSHALDQNRLANIKLNIAGWTNFTQDHLDYHENMENYFQSKLKILKLLENSKLLFVPSGQKELLEKLKGVSCCEVFNSPDNHFFRAEYNKENLQLAVSLLTPFLDFNKNKLDYLSPPPGRFGVYEYGDSYIIIDFAHTPDALESILKEIKISFAGFDIHTVFGCGGDRDNSKRPLMGKIASEHSDKIYITSDNPRFENPQKIINDIKAGVLTDFYENINREQTIKYAVGRLKKSVLLIAGKGHEAYIDINGKKLNYSDHKVVVEIVHAK